MTNIYHTERSDEIIKNVNEDFKDIQCNEKPFSNGHHPFPELLSAEDLLKRKVDNIPCLVDPILPKIGVISLTGPSDVGKSSLLRQLLFYIVNKEEFFLGWRIFAQHYRGIYVTTEDGEEAMSFLLGKQNKACHYSPENCNGLKFIFDTGNLIEQLEYHVSQNPVDVVVIDAFADIYGKGSLNDSNVVRNSIHPFNQLAQKHQCLIIFLHHTGKRTEDGEPSKHNALGSQGFEAKMRLLMELRADPVEPDMRHLCVVKGNYLPAEYKRDSFKLRFDENMIFHNTGQRIPFENLVKQQGIKPEMTDKFTKAKQLKEQGLSYNKIASELGYQNGGAVHKLLNNSTVSRAVSQGNKKETPFPGFQSLRGGNEETLQVPYK